MKWFLDLSLGILAHLLRMVMKPKYFAFWRWLDAPIILWGAWIPRGCVWTPDVSSPIFCCGVLCRWIHFKWSCNTWNDTLQIKARKVFFFWKWLRNGIFLWVHEKIHVVSQHMYVLISSPWKRLGKCCPKNFLQVLWTMEACPSPIVRPQKRTNATGSTESIQLRLVVSNIFYFHPYLGKDEPILTSAYFFKWGGLVQPYGWQHLFKVGQVITPIN